jgi:hypothetical protein
MPLGFDPPHPGGMTENSPTFQRWDSAPEGVLARLGGLEGVPLRKCLQINGGIF